MLIEREFGVRYSEVHVWRLLGQLGLSNQKPDCRALERDEAAIEHWRKRTWPVQKNAGRQGRLVLFIDESGVSERLTQVTAWGGARRDADRAVAFQVSSAVAHCRHALHNSKPHRRVLVRDYVASTARQIQLHFLPGYAPELNPVEFLWFQSYSVWGPAFKDKPVFTTIASDPTFKQTHPNGITERELQALSSEGPAWHLSQSGATAMVSKNQSNVAPQPFAARVVRFFDSSN